MDQPSPIQDRLIAQATQVKAIVAQGHYQVEGRTIDLTQAIASSVAGTRLITPAMWPDLIAAARTRCTGAPATLAVTAETTMQALERLAGENGPDPTCGKASSLAALNFASARRPGGGWDTGARAQEESIGRTSALVATLLQAPGYYAANRAESHLFYTDHAIWSPGVPCFARDNGSLLPTPYTAGMITMPAPNIGAMHLTEADCLALPGVWRRRIADVLALAIMNDVRHLVLGAWGCGVFGNDPILVARWFREALADTPDAPWRRGFASLTFAIFDPARGQPCLAAFRKAFTDGVELPARTATAP